MKKTMMMTAIFAMAAVAGASLTGCSSAARTNTATKAVNLSMPVVNADTAAEKPAAAATEASTEAAAVSTEAATEAPTAAATEAPK
nr:hypothetical protein [Oscillospiraceae bacterium]